MKKVSMSTIRKTLCLFCQSFSWLQRPVHLMQLYTGVQRLQQTR